MTDIRDGWAVGEIVVNLATRQASLVVTRDIYVDSWGIERRCFLVVGSGPRSREYRATLPACGCERTPCTSAHTTSWSERKCGSGKCHAWHGVKVETFATLAIRTYGRGARAHTAPQPASRRGFAPSGTPEAIANLYWDDEPLHDVAEVRRQLALAVTP